MIHRWLDMLRMPWRMLADPGWKAFIELCYREFLGRPADPQGRDFYLWRLRTGAITPADFLKTLLNSPEYRQRRRDALLLEDGYCLADDPNLEPWWNQRVSNHGQRLAEACPISEDSFERHWAQRFSEHRRDQLRVGQWDYIQVHKPRFRELINGILWLLGDQPQPRVLEFGVSEFSGFYKDFMPHMRLFTADLPLPDDHPGFTAAACKDLTRCEAHFGIDLNHQSLLDTVLADQGPYDLIIFTEIVEHLLVNPQTLLQQLLGLLTGEGYLYLTTPNCFSRHHLLKISRRENPQPFFPGAEGNADAHFHYHEYCLSELAQLVHQAGGQLFAGYFSGCWDSPEELAETLQHHPDQKSNLVIVAKRRPKDGHT